MNSLLLYCRAGFEADLANEVQSKAFDQQLYGYAKFDKLSGFVQFICQPPEDANKLARSLPFNRLIFARHMFVCQACLPALSPEDRISPILEISQGFAKCGDLRVEHADTTKGRELSRFCRKFTVPLRQALRRHQRLTAKADGSKPLFQVFFSRANCAYIGYAHPANCSPWHMGILRLKFPARAPSRSTLKLDEALQLFIPAEQRAERIRAGMHAVDLGACPGGWTYQLVSRGMFVEAVDNGSMDAELMASGQVRYFAADGFSYRPQKSKVDWLVCDMIEQPQRVAALMAKWLRKGWCREAVFNLKLPMKKRFESVSESLALIDKQLQQAELQYQCQAKHLYHDREEITVHLRLL